MICELLIIIILLAFRGSTVFANLHGRLRLSRCHCILGFENIPWGFAIFASRLFDAALSKRNMGVLRSDYNFMDSELTGKQIYSL